MENTNPEKIMVITYNASTYLMSVNENDQTDILYDRLSAEIEKNKYVWFPWKNRAETFPQSEKQHLIDRVYEIYLLNKCAKKWMYRIEVDDFRFAENSHDIGFDNFNGESVIDEFKNTKSQLWMRVTAIEKQEKPSDFVKQYSFFHDINPGESTHFTTLYNKRVYGRSFLINSEYCIFFLRKDNDADYPDVPLKPRQSKYAKTFTTIEGNNILMLSDLHCPFPESLDLMSLSYADNMLKKVKRKSPSALIVAGDFSDKNNSAGYDDAIKFISKLSVQNGIKKEAMVFAPGNHDIAYDSENSSEFNYSQDRTKTQYINFYKELLSCDPKLSLCRGAKLILKNGLPLEILALNSVPYTQDLDQRGFGLLTDKHLNHAAEQMGWNENDKTYSYRILVFHHPLFPVGDRSKCNPKERKQEVIINAQVVYNFIQKYGVDLIITGHAHTDGYLRFLREGDIGGVCVWLGLSSCNNQDSKVYCLDFNEYGKVKFFRENIDEFNWREPVATFDIDFLSKR